MKLHYLGTAAAEGWPALFCSCPACAAARAAGGRNIRTRSQALLDGRLLIDFPADTYHHVLANGLDISEVQNLIITHSHEDHWYPDDLGCRYAWASNYDRESSPPLTVWGNATVGRDVQVFIDRYPAENRLQYNPLTPFEPAVIDGYTVTPLPANHDPAALPVIYQITDGEKTMLYCNDTGLPFDSVWEYWAANPVHFDLISLDCTCIVLPCRDGHMGLGTNRELVDKMREYGLVDDTTTVVVNHFSHNGCTIYDDLVKQVAPWGWLVSYDGMTVEF